MASNAPRPPSTECAAAAATAAAAEATGDAVAQSDLASSRWQANQWLSHTHLSSRLSQPNQPELAGPLLAGAQMKRSSALCLHNQATLRRRRRQVSV